VKSRLSFITLIALVLASSFACSAAVAAAPDKSSQDNSLSEAEQAAGWKLLFDGKTLDGWKASENPQSFTVRDGAIVAQARGAAIEVQAGHPKCHLFYVGPDGAASFKDFEFQADVKAEPHGNGGIYFHTEFLANDWPQKGFEVQIDNDPTHDRQTGSLYAVADVAKTPARDGKWFRVQFTVQGKHVVIKLDDQVVVDWTEPAGFVAKDPPFFSERKLSSGTFALQAHDPKSVVSFKNIKVRPLPASR